jgi:hypothetical protein
MGAYPLSIGTSLAFESIGPGPNPAYDPNRIIEHHVDLNDYEQVWINLITLHRNILGSVHSSEVGQLSPADMAGELAIEMEIIRDIVKQNSTGVRVIFYSSSYKGIPKKYPKALCRTAKTSRQQFQVEFAGQCLQEFYKSNKIGPELKHFDLELKAPARLKTLMISHYAYDLLVEKQFKSLDLLESHTGALKNKSLWYTKFEDKRTVRIPFNELFIQIFGDSSLFFMHDGKLRDDLITLAEDQRWTYATGQERVNLCLKYLKDPYAIKVLQSMQ